MKRLLLLIGIISISISLSAQFFKPVRSDLFTNITVDSKTKGTSVWLPRPAYTIVANKWWIDKETKKIESKLFSAVAFGIGWQHYTPTSETDPTPYNNLGVNILVSVGEDICAGATFNYNLAGQVKIDFGLDYNFKQTRPELLTGIKIDF